MPDPFEEARSMAQDLIENLDPAHEVEQIRGIHKMMKRSADARSKQVDSIQGTLKALSRTLQTAQISTASPKYSLDLQQFSDRMIALDREKYSISRNIAEVDDSVEGLEAQLRNLQREEKELEQEEIEEEEKELSATCLKLQIYKELGITLQRDDTGQIKGCKVLCYPKRDIQFIDFEDKFSRFYYANFLWDLSS
ncbi:Spc24 subunit of Ndc80-domain-containing protein [Gaertneriomyces semiglobifer]|nr:Spc24 subunit of Ndc80-domain-containing protein [Gaertneriomyces semiglobifer]